MTGTEQFILSALIFAVGLLAAVLVPIAMQRLPTDYLAQSGPPPSSESGLSRGLRTAAGALLILIGLLLLLRWPIRALTLIGSGVAAATFPGKHVLLRKLLASPTIRDFANGLRDAGHVGPFLVSNSPPATDEELRAALAARLAGAESQAPPATPESIPRPAPADEPSEETSTLDFAPDVDWDEFELSIEPSPADDEGDTEPDEPSDEQRQFGDRIPTATERPSSVSVDSMTLSQASLASPYLRTPDGEAASSFAFDPRASSRSGFHHGRRSIAPPRRSPTKSVATVGSGVVYAEGGPLFTAYLVVSWSAASRPGRGKNTVWWCAVERGNTGTITHRLENPSTRVKALEQIGDLFSDWIARGVSGVAAFDFSFGFPRGFGQATGVRVPRWRGTWELISGRIRDEQIGRKWNNRFEVADSLNKLVDGDGPFWSHPPNQEFSALVKTAPQNPGVPASRHCDDLIEPSRSVWKMMYGGSIGGETLLGIPYVQHLSTAIELEDAVTVWPFDRESTKPIVSLQPRIVLAETTLAGVEAPADGEVPPSAAAARGLAEQFERLDRHGALASFLAAPDQLPDEIRKEVVTEEGWVLGLPAPEPSHWD